MMEMFPERGPGPFPSIAENARNHGNNRKFHKSALNQTKREKSHFKKQ